jgi:hypothetical protein
VQDYAEVTARLVEERRGHSSQRCPITASTRGRNAQPVASLNTHIEFRWQPTAPITVQQGIFTAFGRRTTSETVGL